jgi:hypothetical protein
VCFRPNRDKRLRGWGFESSSQQLLRRLIIWAVPTPKAVVPLTCHSTGPWQGIPGRSGPLCEHVKPPQWLCSGSSQADSASSILVTRSVAKCPTSSDAVRGVCCLGLVGSHLGFAGCPDYGRCLLPVGFAGLPSGLPPVRWAVNRAPGLVRTIGRAAAMAACVVATDLARPWTLGHRYCCGDGRFSADRARDVWRR